MTVSCKIIKTSDDFKGNFTIYYLSLFLRKNDTDELINKQPLKKRYSDFLNYKENLEARFKCSIPYFFPLKNDTNEYKTSAKQSKSTWFNPLSLVSSNKSTDRSVVNFRKEKLENFLNDVLSDSFDDKWKKSIITSNFLEIDRKFIAEQPNAIDLLKPDSKLSDAYFASAKDDNEIQDWWVTFRHLSESLNSLTENEEDHEMNLKALMKSRLLLQSLEAHLHDTDKPRDLKKRESHFKKIKEQLYEHSNKLSSKKTPAENRNKLNSLLDRASLISSNSSTSISSLKAKPGRTIGSKRQILDDQKVELKSQEQQLEELHQTIVMQKNLGININNELKSQMELMDSMGEDLTDTSRKMNRANNKAKKYNNSS